MNATSLKVLGTVPISATLEIEIMDMSNTTVANCNLEKNSLSLIPRLQEALHSTGRLANLGDEMDSGLRASTTSRSPRLRDTKTKQLAPFIAAQITMITTQLWLSAYPVTQLVVLQTNWLPLDARSPELGAGFGARRPSL